MKRYLYSVLGSLTAIWLSVFLGFFLLILVIGVAAQSEETKLTSTPNSILHLNLNGALVDRAQENDIWTALYDNSIVELPLNKLLLALKKAAVDPNIEGVFIECNGVSGGLAQLEELTDALTDFKNNSGKWIVAYSDNYSQGDYYVASFADSLILNPIGMVDIHGLSATTMYFKTLLDKVGVEAQVVKVGTYKSAVEPFILTQMSDANREQQKHFLTKMWNVFSSDIAVNRQTTVEHINNWANSYLATLDTEYYLSQNVIDSVMYRSDFNSYLASLSGIDSDKDPKLIDAVKYSEADIKLEYEGKSAKIAVLYALGDITESGKDGIASDRLIPEIEDITEDESIDGLILRVNSGGGSAFASEQIWEALQQYKKKTGKPFYVSMGDYAASGGYYISCGADQIYACPLTLTGSIGIFGIIPNAENLLKDKLGINYETVATNTGELPGFLKPMSEGQRSAMQNYVNRGYELFVSRCASGRNMPVDSIKAIAEGRVWDGVSAKELGLVDKIGTLSDAISEMANNLDAGNSYTIVAYPDVKTKWWQALSEIAEQTKTAEIKKEFGAAYPYYQMLNNFSQMDKLQCRMDFITVQ